MQLYQTDGLAFVYLMQNLIDVIGYVLVLLSSSIIDWNNPLIINKMYKVYLGDVPLKTKVCKLDVLIFKLYVI